MDWNGARQRLQHLGALSFRVDKVGSAGYRVTFLLLPLKPPQCAWPWSEPSDGPTPSQGPGTKLVQAWGGWYTLCSGRKPGSCWVGRTARKETES